MPKFNRAAGYVEYEFYNKDATIHEIHASRGNGRKVLRMFLNFVYHKYPDAVVYLTASDTYGVPLLSLVRFYESFGFIVCSGRRTNGKDYFIDMKRTGGKSND